MFLPTDLRYAIRTLRKSPALAAVAIASLALGIGANVTVYSVVREMILDDISALDASRLVRVNAEVSYARYRDLRHASAFQDLAFETGLHDTNWQVGDHSEVAWGMDTSPNFFEVLGSRPAIGHLYSQADEDRPVAVVTNGFWRRRLDSDPNVVGRALVLNGRLYTVAGVLPRDYRSVMGHGVSPEIYTPARMDATRGCHPFGRLHDGVSLAHTRQSLVSTAALLDGPDFARRVSHLRPMDGWAANAAGEGDDRRFFVFFVMLFCVAGLMALIACSNVAGLLLARNVSRQREVAMRKALGASRWQAARPLLVEGSVLVACGAAAGLGLDAFLRDRLSYVRWPSAYNIPFEFHFQNDTGLLMYALLTAALALLISSVLPALRGSNVDLGVAMKPRANQDAAVRWNSLNGVVALQVIFSTLLLTLGILFARSLLHIVRGELGFDAAHTVIAAVHPLPGQYRGEAGWAWRDRLIRRVQQVPGVLAVTSTGLLPLMGEVPQTPVRRESEQATAIRDIYSMGVGERYFTALGVRILRGRDFEIADRGRKPTPAIINRTLAQQYFPDIDPIGAHLLRGREKEDLLEVVGVVADTKMRTLGEDNVPAFFTPDFNGQLLVRVTGNSAQWILPLRAALGEVDNASALDIRPMYEAVAGALFPMQAAAGFVGSLSGVGLVLSLIGLYASVSYAVSRRTKEIGIRAALGATRGKIVWTALRDGAAILATGSVIGLALFVAAIRPLVELLPDGVDPWNPWMFAAVAALLLATGALAAVVPAHRAASIDPAVALRDD